MNDQKRQRGRQEVPQEHRMTTFPMSLTEDQIKKLEILKEKEGIRKRTDLIRNLIVTHPKYQEAFGS